MMLTEFFLPLLILLLLVDHLFHLSTHFFDRQWNPSFQKKTLKTAYHWDKKQGLLQSSLFALLAYAGFTYSGDASITLGFAVIFIHVAIIMSVIDIRYQILPDLLTLILLLCGLAANSLTVYTTLSNALIGCLVGYTSLWVINALFKLLRKKEGMGHGDFKLFSALGAWFGVLALPYMLFIASVLFVCVNVVIALVKKKSMNDPYPFGPFLLISALTFLFFNDTLMAYFI